MNHRTFTRLFKVTVTVFAVIGLCDIVQFLTENAWQLASLLNRFPMYLRTLIFIGVCVMISSTLAILSWWFINHVLKSQEVDREMALRYEQYWKRYAETHKHQN